MGAFQAGERDDQARKGRDQSMKRYRVAMIGVGGISGAHHTMLSALPERCEVVGMYDVDPERLRQRREEWGYRAFDSLEELLAEQSDVAWIMTPVQPRLALLAACFGAGRHCFTEKPLALNVADAEKAVRLARNAGRRLFVGHNMRNTPDTCTMGQLFFSGALGELIKVYYHTYVQRVDDFWARKFQGADAWRLSFDQCGGRIFEFSIHGVNWLQWIGGQPLRVYGTNAAVSKTLAEAGLDDVVSAHVAFERGYGVNETIMAPGVRSQRWVGIVGTRGECWLEGGKIRVVIPGDERDELIDPEPCPDRAESFFNSLDRDEAPVNDGAAALATTRICCAFNESVRTGNAVQLT